MTTVSRRRAPADAACYQKKRALTVLQQLRLARGLEQGDVAAQIGTDDSAVSYWETYRREPRGQFRRAYSRALGITVGELGRIIYQHSLPVQRARARGAK